MWLTLALCVIWLALVARVLFRHDRIGAVEEATFLPASPPGAD
jgi:hypothetical protein